MVIINMGNTSSDIVSRVANLSKDQLGKTLKEDLELLSNPNIIFDTSEILCRNDLDIYLVPGSDYLSLKTEDVGTNHEESMVCSLINSARLREKHEDTTKALLEEIIRKRGDDPNSKELILRMQGCSRIFEALLRTDERTKRQKAEKTVEKTNAKVGLPNIAKATMKFGFNTIMRVVNMMGSKNPQVYKFMISHTSEVLSEMKPLSLKSDDPSVNATIEKLVIFFENILNGQVGNLNDSDKQSSVSSLFALAIVSGNVFSTLSLADYFLKLKISNQFSAAIPHLAPHLKAFKETIIYSQN